MLAASERPPAGIDGSGGVMKIDRNYVLVVLVGFAVLAINAESYLRLDRDFAPAPGIEQSPLYRKKIAVIGDSYVQNHVGSIADTWHYRLAQKYQMHYLNYGRNGNRMVIPRPANGVEILKRYTEIPADVDYLVVVAGHNDAYAIMRLNGQDIVTETTPEIAAKRETMLAQFKSGCRELCAKLKERYPRAKIAFVTPWAVDRPFFPQIIETIKAETAAAGIPCFDASSAGINPNDAAVRKRYFQSEKDDAHLNPAGHGVMLEAIEGFFKTL